MKFANIFLSIFRFLSNLISLIRKKSENFKIKKKYTKKCQRAKKIKNIKNISKKYHLNSKNIQNKIHYNKKKE